jgi:hypothetical protein
MLMLAPYGISVPTFIEAAPAGPPETVVKLDDLYSTSYMPKVHTGGTIALPPVFTVVDPSHRIH